jgi:hypothetical protein
VASLDDDGWIVFDPDFELEWEVGPDVEIVFQPDEEDEAA